MSDDEQQEWSVPAWIEWGKEMYSEGDPPWTNKQWTTWAREQRRHAQQARAAGASGFASPDRYVAMKEQSAAACADATSPTASEKGLVEAVANEEQAHLQVLIGYGKFKERSLLQVQRENPWYLSWVVKEGIEHKSHAKHLAPGLRLLGYYDTKLPPTPLAKEPPAAAEGAEAKTARAASTRSKAKVTPLQEVRAVLLRMKEATVIEVPGLIEEALALCG